MPEQKIDLDFLDAPKVDLSFLDQQPQAPPVAYVKPPASQYHPGVLGSARDAVLGATEGLGIDPAAPLTSILKGIWGMAKTGAGVVQDLADPMGTLARPKEAYARVAPILDPMVEQEKQAIGYAKNLSPLGSSKNATPVSRLQDAGNLAGALVHGVAGAIPIIGPAAAEAGNSINKDLESGDTGEIPHDVGKAVGFVGGLAAMTPEGEAAIGKVAGAAGKLPGDMLKSVAKKAGEFVTGVPSEPIDAAVRAIKPKATNTQFKGNMPDVLSHLKDSLPDLGRPISEDPGQVFQDVLDLTKITKKKLWDQRSALVDPLMKSTVDASPVADAIVGSIPTKTWIKDPDLAQGMSEEAAVYRQHHTLSDLEDMLHTTNAELDAYYDKYPTSKRNASAKNPDTAALFAEGQSLRKLIYGTVDDVQGMSGPAAEASRRYGKLLNFEEELYRRKNVFDRQQPNSLQQQATKLGMAKELGIGAAKMAGGVLSGSPEVAGVAAYSATKNLAGAWAMKKMSDFLKERGSSATMLRNAITDDRIPAPTELSAPYSKYTRAPLSLPPMSEPGVIPSSGSARPMPADLDEANFQNDQAQGRTSLVPTSKPLSDMGSTPPVSQLPSSGVVRSDLPINPRPQLLERNMRPVPLSQLPSSGQTFEMPPSMDQPALPPHPTEMGPGEGDVRLKDLNVVRGSAPDSYVGRDPKTGRMKRIYTGVSSALKDSLDKIVNDQRGAVSLSSKGISPIAKKMVKDVGAKIVDPEKPVKGTASLFIDDKGAVVDVNHDHWGTLGGAADVDAFDLRDDTKLSGKTLSTNKLARINMWGHNEIAVEMHHPPSKATMDSLNTLIENNPKIKTATWDLPGAKTTFDSTPGTPSDMLDAIYKAFPDAGKKGAKPDDIFAKYAASRLSSEKGAVPLSAFGSKRFFSKLAEGIDEKGPTKAPAQQFLDIADKMGKESEASGLKGWLQSLGSEKIAKSDVLAKIDEGAPKLKEHWLEGKPAESEDYDVEDLEDQREELDAQQANGDITDEEYEDQLNDLEDQIEQAGQRPAKKLIGPKFENYTLPGGTNYREYVATLPSNDKMLSFDDWKKANVGKFYPAQLDKEYKIYADGYDKYRLGYDASKDYKVPGGHAYGDKDLDTNRLFHARTKDRVTADGGKSLFMEELQSDWHQAGRKNGYKPTAPEVAKVIPTESEVGPIALKLRRAGLKADTGYDITLQDLRTHRPETIPYDKFKAKAGLTDSEIDILKRYNQNTNSTANMVPDAPYKNDWHELGMKRMLQEAAEKNYDSLSWTTGKQQADRYQLSKQVDALSYNAETQVVQAYKGQNKVVDKKNVKPEELADLVGKEVASKLLEAQPTSTYSGTRWLKGQDLDIGGEGMKGFYDQIIPRFMDKYLKKYGVKAEKVELGSSAPPNSYTKSYTDKHGPVSTWHVDKYHDVIDLSNRIVREFDSADDANTWIKNFNDETKGPQVWQVKITPKMREDFTTKGQPR